VTINAIEATAGGRPVVLLRPDVSQPARCGIDLVAAAAHARETGGAVYLLLDGQSMPVSVDGVPVITPHGMQRVWLSVVWRTASAARDVRARWRHLEASVVHEWRRELRRHIGDERLPFELRQRLRGMAEASTRRGRSETNAFPRRMLRAPSAVSLSSDFVEEARSQLTALGITDGRPLVTFESRTRPDIAVAVMEYLVDEGYAVARIGEPADSVHSCDGVVDLTTRASRPLSLEMFLVSASAFIMCESIELQQLAYLVNTPSLMINARDPFVAYPVRANGLVALSSAIDLESAQRITIGDMLTQPYFRDLHKQQVRGRRRGSHGYRDNTVEELTEAIQEMRAGITDGWTSESESQSRFRQRVVEAGAALAPISAHVTEWGPDDGFIGDGRLVRFQADGVS
jgi:putative glycosyltransferase (TIGR04372 family)